MIGERQDVAILALVLFAVTCLTIFFLRVAQPTGGLLGMLFAQL
jgi:hypothetical protein